jgi:transposase
MPVKAIARVMGVSRNTVRAAIACDRPPKYQRPAKGSIVDAAEPRIRELLRAYPTMPATVIAERIGWERSIRVLRDRVAELRPAYLPPDPASRTAYAAGEVAQCDLWFPPVTVPVGFGQARKPAQLPVLTMVCAYSRWLAATLIPTRTAADLFAGWWQLISSLGAVPRVLVWDGEGAIGRWRAGRVELTAGPMTTSNVRSCPAARSPARPTSTPSSPRGWRWSTPARGGRWAVPRPSGSPPTSRPC